MRKSAIMRKRVKYLKTTLPLYVSPVNPENDVTAVREPRKPPGAHVC